MEIEKIVNNFIENDIKTNIDERSKYLTLLPALISTDSKEIFKDKLSEAVNHVDKESLKEAVYQTVPYLGFGKVYPFLVITEEVLGKTEEASITNNDNRYSKGLETQYNLFGKETIDNLDKYLNGNLINYTLEEISKIDGYETTYSSDTFTIVNNHRILTVTKTVDKTTVNPGDTLTYTITVSNDSDVEANDIVLVDNLDTNLEFISSEGGVYDLSTHTVIYKIDALNPNEKKIFTLVTRVKDDVTSGTAINNTALVLGNDNDEEVPSNEVTTTVEEPPKDEVIEIVNPETSDNINIIYLTALVDMLLLGFFVRRKREN